MNDLAKSMFSFSWAMSLFGVRQLVNALAPDRAARSFDEVTRATADELGGTLAAAFRTGDALQRSLWDLGLGWTGQGRSGGGRGVRRGEGTAWADARTAAYDARPAARPAPAAAPALPAEGDVSAEFSYAPHYVDVFGSRMHYVTAGEGRPIVLLHGNPTWSYVWRNIIPHLAPHGRVIAPDLIGFGRSDKPPIDYTWFDHARYVHGFFDALGLDDVVLVLHDQGSAQGFRWASRHPERVRAIAFFESIVRPFPWDEFSTPEFRQLFQAFRTGGVGGQGWQMIVDQNLFIEQLLPQAAGRPLSEREMDFYREPFRVPSTRLPVWQFPRQTPIGGEPRDVWDAASEYSAWLCRSEHPKLMLYATPGALLTAENVAWCQRNIRNLESVALGAGSHFLQESSPHRIGREIAGWLGRLDAGGGARAGGGTAAPGPVAPAAGAAAGDAGDGIPDLRAEVDRMLQARDPELPIAAIVLFQVDPAKEDRFVRNGEALTAATRRLPGCNVFAFHRALRPSAAGGGVEHLIYEDWETTRQFRVQWGSEHLQAFQAAVGDLLVAPPDLRFYDGWREYRFGGGGR